MEAVLFLKLKVYCKYTFELWEMSFVKRLSLSRSLGTFPFALTGSECEGACPQTTFLRGSLLLESDFTTDIQWNHGHLTIIIIIINTKVGYVQQVPPTW